MNVGVWCIDAIKRAPFRLLVLLGVIMMCLLLRIKLVTLNTGARALGLSLCIMAFTGIPRTRLLLSPLP